MALFRHLPLGEEVTSISGTYALLEEGEAYYGIRRFIFLVGIAETKSACCGTFGGRFIQVVGYPRTEKRQESAGKWVTEVEPIASPTDQTEISSLLSRRYPHSQISFLAFPRP